MNGSVSKISHVTFYSERDGSKPSNTIFLNLNEFILKSEDVKISLDLLDIFLTKLRITTKLIKKGNKHILMINLKNHIFNNETEKEEFTQLLENSITGIYKILQLHICLSTKAFFYYI